MSRHEPTELAEIETLASFLDSRAQAGDAPPMSGSTRLPDDLVATAWAVDAASQPRGLSARFTQRLEENLMDLAALDHPHAVVLDHRPAPRLTPSPTPRRFPRRAASPPAPVTGRRSGVGSFVGFAALIGLIAAIFAQTIGPGGNFAFWQDATPAPTSTVFAGHLRVDAARTGSFADPGPSGLPALLWRRENPISEYSVQAITDGTTLFHLPTGAPDLVTVVDDGAYATGLDAGYIQTFVVADDMLIAALGANDDGALVAYGRSGGLIDASTILWRVETRASAGGLALSDDRVYMVDVDGVLHAHALSDGAEIWSVDLVDPEKVDVIFQPASHVITDVTPAVANGQVVVSTQGGAVRAFSADDGAERWTFQADEGYVGAPTIAGDAVYVAGRAEGEPLQAVPPREGHVYAIDATTGAELWRHESAAWSGEAATSPFGNRHTPLVLTIDDTHVYLNGDGENGNLVTALSLASGDPVWSTEFDVVSGGSPVAAGDMLYLTRPDGGVYSLDGASGEIRWRLDTGTADLLSPVVIGDLLVVVTGEGVSLGLGDPGDGTPTEVASPAASGNDISGLPPCVSPRLRPDPLPTGEPSTKIDLPERTGDRGTSSIIRGDVPTEPFATADTFVDILDTFAAIATCNRPGYEAEVGGYFSDDFYRRTALRFSGFDLTRQIPSLSDVLYRYSSTPASDLERPFILDDGRVAILLWTDLYHDGQLVVFVEQDGTLLIDEIARITEEPGQGMG